MKLTNLNFKTSEIAWPKVIKIEYKLKTETNITKTNWKSKTKKNVYNKTKNPCQRRSIIMYNKTKKQQRYSMQGK